MMTASQTSSLILIINVKNAYKITHLYSKYQNWDFSCSARCRVLSLSDCRYSLNPLSQTRID